MSTAKSFLEKIRVIKESINEAAGRLTKQIVIRDGKKVVLKVREYATECPDGYKRNSETGRCERMSAEEKRNRSIASLKASNKSSTKRRRAIGMKRRDSLIKD